MPTLWLAFIGSIVYYFHVICPVRIMTFLHRKEGNSPPYTNRRCAVHLPKQKTPFKYDHLSSSNIYSFTYVIFFPALYSLFWEPLSLWASEKTRLLSVYGLHTLNHHLQVGPYPCLLRHSFSPPMPSLSCPLPSEAA